ncbi:AraC family transcriptional regulator [Stenotrophobium rhamnosiphilum]|uniref:AraC family transcriptional regulator n=1 Tax=Stenotrophobium rhamnosiphilum TaxID=2029166 RepID=A0A2T5MGP7_9GAMM|nr:AraC family transcriptional regulator [Stenotrophobium rhamnosiphilum]PTU31752.1 AraC family transcriptional regulator [Stenotrophobium rhamnosiphilum]
MPNPLTAHATGHTASLAYLRGLLDYVQTRGLTLEQLLEGRQIDLEDRDARLAESECAALFDRAAALLNDDALGLHAGEQIRPGHYGALGYVAMNCATLGEALSGLRRYHALVLDIGPMEQTMENGQLCLSWNPDVEHPYRQMAEYNLAGLVTFSRWISGRRNNPLRIDFTYAAPKDLTEHERVLGCPLRFSQDRYRLLMSVDWLAQPLIQPDASMRKMMEQLAERQMQSLTRGDAIADARAAIARQLGEGDVELTTIAKQLNLSSRTLQRKLQDTNLSFTQLVDDVRRELAERYLADATLDLVDIAFLLGYSEQSAFTRAYKRWTGRAPAATRGGK